MASFRAIPIFLLGTVVGFGAALVTLAHLLHPMQDLGSLDSLNAFRAGVFLIVTGFIGGIEVAWGKRTWRLRAVLTTIALLAVLLGGSIALRRRTERLGELWSQHDDEGKRFAIQGRDIYNRLNPSPEVIALLRRAHWHLTMSEIPPGHRSPLAARPAFRAVRLPSMYRSQRRNV